MMLRRAGREDGEAQGCARDEEEGDALFRPIANVFVVVEDLPVAVADLDAEREGHNIENDERKPC